MATPLQKVYDAFLARIAEDEWMINDDITYVQQDWRQLLDIAIFRLKFPRVSLEIAEDGENFVNNLTSSEIQLLAVFMKHEWVKRCVADWQNLRQLYTDKDFSPANFLSKLQQTEEAIRVECSRMYGIYDRSRNGTASGFRGLSGSND